MVASCKPANVQNVGDGDDPIVRAESANNPRFRVQPRRNAEHGEEMDREKGPYVSLPIAAGLVAHCVPFSQ